MLCDPFTVPKVIQVHLFTFCFALKRVKRPVFCFHGHYTLKPRFRPAPGWVVKVCVCYLCVGPQCLISVNMLLFSMLNPLSARIAKLRQNVIMH